MNGKLDSQLVIQMIGGTWVRQIATYSSQPDGPLKGAGGYYHISLYIYIDIEKVFQILSCVTIHI